MRRFLKPVLVTVGAASAAFLIANTGAAFNGAPAKAVKANTFCNPESAPINANKLKVNAKKPSTKNLGGIILPVPLPIQLPSLPPIPPIPTPNIGCIPLPTIPVPNLGELPISIPLPINIPTPNISIPPIFPISIPFPVIELPIGQDAVR